MNYQSIIRLRAGWSWVHFALC